MEFSKHLTDDELVKMYIDGNNEAFDLLLERYKTRLFSYIVYNVQNEDLANDIFQETFVKAIVRIQAGQYTASGKFQAWITCIAHNIIMDYFRRKNYENKIPDNETNEQSTNNQYIYDFSIESTYIHNQSLNDIVTIYKMLPKAQSQVVYMRFYQDMSFKEIAEELNISINTALGRMRYALINMKRIATEKKISFELI